ncbi:amino acid adenylation, partial [Pseudomonas syringae pv. pisi str. 1704B]
YNVPIILHLAAGVELNALADAVQRLLTRHSGLRTAFVSAADGLHQEVHQRDAVCQTFATGAFSEQTWRSFAALVFDTPFDLATSALCKAWLLPFADGSCRLLLNLHHVAIDGWSMNLLFDDLVQLYDDALQGRPSAEPSPGLGTLEFALWQRQWRVDPRYRDQRRALAGLHRQHPASSPALLPVREPGPQARLYRQPLGATRSAALDRFCSRQRVTRYEVLFSVYAWSIYALTGCERPRIASPVSNRPLSEFEDAIGMFANTVLIPTAFDGDKALGQQLHQQTATVREVLALQDVALADPGG